MDEKLIELQDKIEYRFKNLNLLKRALSHRSVGKDNNERLEFLGDAALNFIIAETLYEQYPHAKEGELSRLRASLVKTETLTRMAAQFGLANYLFLGAGEQRSIGDDRSSIQGDAIEAIIGAIYLDGNFEMCRDVVLGWFESMLDQAKYVTNLKDSKTQLQEYLQGKKFPLPIYDIIDTRGEAHNQVFHVQCTVEGLKFATLGIGHSRRKAEQQAAEKYLEILRNG